MLGRPFPRLFAFVLDIDLDTDRYTIETNRYDLDIDDRLKLSFNVCMKNTGMHARWWRAKHVIETMYVSKVRYVELRHPTAVIDVPRVSSEGLGPGGDQVVVGWGRQAETG